MGLLKRIERNINARKYDKAIEESSGLKKICLMVRNQGVEFALNLSKGSNDSNLSLEMMNVLSTQMSFAEFFYTTLNDLFEKAGGSPDEMFEDLANELYEDYDKRRLIASRLFGIALGIFMHKAASISDTEISKKGISKLIESSRIKEIFKGEINNSFSSMMNFYDDPVTGAGTEGTIASHDLGVVAYSIVDMKLGGKHFADLTYMMAAITAEALAYRETSVTNFEVEGLKKARLLESKYLLLHSHHNRSSSS